MCTILLKISNYVYYRHMILEYIMSKPCHPFCCFIKNVHILVMQFCSFMTHLKTPEWLTQKSWLMEEFSGVRLVILFSLSHRWNYTNTSLTNHYASRFFYSRLQTERHICQIKLPDFFFSLVDIQLTRKRKEQMVVIKSDGNSKQIQTNPMKAC